MQKYLNNKWKTSGPIKTVRQQNIKAIAHHLLSVCLSDGVHSWLQTPAASLAQAAD